VDESADRLVALVADLEDALAKEIRVESRRFHPHLTVARSELPLRLPDGFRKTSCSAGPFNIEEVVLFQSHLQRPRPRYEALRSFSLGR
jgi:2'-5' RNA ligase